VQHPWARTVLEVLELRACAHAMTPAPELVVLLAWDEMPSLVAALAPTRARVLVNEFSNPRGIFRSRVFDPVARVREWQRRRGGADRGSARSASRRVGRGRALPRSRGRADRRRPRGGPIPRPRRADTSPPKCSLRAKRANTVAPVLAGEATISVSFAT
jgi:hypothetical protein